MTVNRYAGWCLIILIGLLMHVGADAACFEVSTGNGLATWKLAETDRAVEIEVVVPFVDPALPIEEQVNLILADAPFRHKVIIQLGAVFKNPRDFLPKLSEREIAAYASLPSPDSKRRFAGWRMLGYYMLLRPKPQGGVTILAQGNRNFVPVVSPVPVQSGDVLVLTELAGCL